GAGRPRSDGGSFAVPVDGAGVPAVRQGAVRAGLHAGLLLFPRIESVVADEPAHRPVLAGGGLGGGAADAVVRAMGDEVSEGVDVDVAVVEPYRLPAHAGASSVRCDHSD